MPLLADLVDARNADGKSFLHGAFLIALDDFAAHRGDEPNIDDSVVVAAALAVMSRIDAERIDPVRLADHDRAETAQMLVARCAAYAPLFAVRAPQLSPWFDALGGAGPQLDSVLDGGSADTLDVDWLARLAPAVFRFPAARGYLARFLDAAISRLAPDTEPSGALWLCLRFRRWATPSAAQRAVLASQVDRWRGSNRHPVMRAALRKLDTTPSGAVARMRT